MTRNGSDFARLLWKLGAERLPEIADGVEVRPLLKTEDLRLLRRVFLRDIRSGSAGSDEAEMGHLMRRILRKVK